MEKEKVSINILNDKHSQSLFHYYLSNKRHLEKWEKKRTNDFYTPKYFLDKVLEIVNEMRARKTLNFLMGKKIM